LQAERGGGLSFAGGLPLPGQAVQPQVLAFAVQAVQIVAQQAFAILRWLPSKEDLDSALVDAGDGAVDGGLVADVDGALHGSQLFTQGNKLTFQNTPDRFGGSIRQFCFKFDYLLLDGGWCFVHWFSPGNIAFTYSCASWFLLSVTSDE
jgi:hypothetical protein